MDTDGDVTPRARPGHGQHPRPLVSIYNKPSYARSQPVLPVSLQPPRPLDSLKAGSDRAVSPPSPVFPPRFLTSIASGDSTPVVRSVDAEFTASRTPVKMQPVPLVDAYTHDAAQTLYRGHQRVDSDGRTSEGGVVYRPDYDDKPPSSMGSLSRGPSTVSSVPSSLQSAALRDHGLQQSVQQDFFLDGLHLTAEQRGLLLVCLPTRVMEQYAELYALDFCTQAPHEDGAVALLLKERAWAQDCLLLSPLHQQALFKACHEILSAPSGSKRLCRVVRWLLHGDVQQFYEGRYVPNHHIAPLSSLQLRSLLVPLQLNGGQAARLGKHCEAVAQKSPVHRPLQATYASRV